jgi:hypothetical protein
MHIHRSVVPLLLFLLPSFAGAQVCDDRDFRDQLRHLAAECGASKCRTDNPVTSRDGFIQSLRTPPLVLVHVFFPSGETDVQKTFDWKTRRRLDLEHAAELAQRGNQTAYIFARASMSGDPSSNSQIAAERLRTVADWLRRLSPSLRIVRISLGTDALVLSRQDADVLALAPMEYRNDTWILNQSVQILLYPCDAP